MSTHNIGFYEEISKIITKLSSNILKYDLISSPERRFMIKQVGGNCYTYIS